MTERKKDMKAQLGAYPKDRQILYEVLPLETPLVVDIHITHLCNFKCNYCILSQYEEDFKKSGLKREEMTMETFSVIVEQLKEFPDKIKMITKSGIGEATTHPLLVEFVRMLHDAEVTNRIQLITNGYLLTPELGERLVAAGLGELKISLQGLSADKYMEIAGKKIDWEEFYGNLCHFSKIKKECDFKLKVADTALEDGDEERFYKLFGEICDAVAVEHIYDAWSANDAKLEYGIKPEEKTLYGREMRHIKICRRPFTSCDVLPDGFFTQFCHVHFGHEKNIREATIKEQWNSAGQNELRINMLKGKREEYPHCKVCTVVHNTWQPEDLLEGHEEEILTRMQNKGIAID